jgi:hypothetical protein
MVCEELVLGFDVAPLEYRVRPDHRHSAGGPPKDGHPHPYQRIGRVKSVRDLQQRIQDLHALLLTPEQLSCPCHDGVGLPDERAGASG